MKRKISKSGTMEHDSEVSPQLAQRGRITFAITETDDGEVKTFKAWLVPEQVETVDKRIMAEDSLSFRSEKMPFMFNPRNTGHSESTFAGNLVKPRFETLDGVKWAVADVDFDSGETGQEARRLVLEERMETLSVDPGKYEYEIEILEYDEDGWPVDWLVTFTEYEIAGVTQLPFQAMDDSRVELVASGGPETPPIDWFTDPEFEPGDGRLVRQPDGGYACPLTITDDGRVFGHVARWEQPHISFSGKNVVAPRSTTEYAYFKTGEVETDGGKIPVGHLTIGTNHAGRKLTATATVEHYENTGAVFADVAAGEDQFGIWISGSLRPELTPQEEREARRAKLSGDWRWIGNSLEMVGVLAVNTGGFPIARVDSGKQLALVAAGMVERTEAPDSTATAIDSLAGEVRALIVELRRPLVAAAADSVLAEFDDAP